LVNRDSGGQGWSAVDSEFGGFMSRLGELTASGQLKILPSQHLALAVGCVRAVGFELAEVAISSISSGEGRWQDRLVAPDFAALKLLPRSGS
jgi:hypothetical protein